MGYLFLTGATGLVGRYLLRDLILSDVPVAAMVRPGKGPATLEGIMSHWEAELGRSLPRPVVIQGDLNSPEVVSSEAQRQWLADHADRMLHCAASMTFREDKKGEPFRTNIDGTRNLLGLVKSVGIRQYHHVSTAYICGLRQGQILESDVDQGQTLGNVYEKSKLEAEKMVRASDFLDSRTFYRPASVVGDSRSGYVTSFHGFYLPLQLAHVMAGKIPVREMNERFFAKLGLRGDEGKNLVPVDWLAAAIVHLVTHPEHHNQTYHLANPKPVPVVEIQKIIRDAIEQHYPKALATTISEEELKSLEAAFYEYMLIYESHWRDDPKFDVTNTRAALPHLPCPEMTYEVLMNVSRYPVARNFMAPRHEHAAVAYDVRSHLEHLFSNGNTRSTTNTPDDVGLQVSGAGGGQWRLRLAAGQVAGLDAGLPLADSACCYLSAATFRSLVLREVSVAESINSGRLMVDAGSQPLSQLIGVLEQVIANGAAQTAGAKN